MGSVHVRKDGKVHTLNEEAKGAQVKQLLNLPPDSVLVNARNEQIADYEAIGTLQKLYYQRGIERPSRETLTDIINKLPDKAAKKVTRAILVNYYADKGI